MVLTMSAYEPGMAPALVVNHTANAIKMNQKGEADFSSSVGECGKK